jgi:5-formyltetrahydrofolate cyclo-ligase
MCRQPSKSALRSSLKSILSIHSDEANIDASRDLSDQLHTSALYLSTTTILAYAALPEEISLDPFILTALDDGKQICIPQIDWETKSMHPAQINNLDTDLETGRYSVRAPRDGCPLVDPNDIDMILIPGLAFDRNFNRLGRGAGFYDRMIESLPSPRPTLIGVCFACQIVETVPTEPHDYPMDRVITEVGLLDGQ